MTAKEKLLEEAPGWTDAQEAGLSADELDRREDRWAEANAREAVREEPW